MDMDMDNAELKDLRELKAIKEEYGWPDDHPQYKLRLKAIQKKYSQLAKAESKSKGGKVKAPGQKMNKFVWGAKGGFKEIPQGETTRGAPRRDQAQGREWQGARPADEEDGVGRQGWLQGGDHRCRGVG